MPARPRRRLARRPGARQRLRIAQLRRAERARHIVAVRRVFLVAVARRDGVVGVGEDEILPDALAVFVGDAHLELRAVVSVVGRLAEPGDRLRVVALDALALGVEQAQVVLGDRIALLRRLAEPLDRLRVVLLHAVAGRVDDGQLDLRLHVALRRGLAQPAHRLRLVGGEALAVFVHEPDAVLRFRIAALGERAKLAGGGRVVVPFERGDAFVHAGAGGHGGQERDGQKQRGSDR